MLKKIYKDKLLVETNLVNFKREVDYEILYFEDNTCFVLLHNCESILEQVLLEVKKLTFVDDVVKNDKAYFFTYNTANTKEEWYREILFKNESEIDFL